ncbi:hypothetical protein [Limosilactobacillus fermentum]
MQLKFDWFLDSVRTDIPLWSGITLAAVLIVLLIITLFGHGHSYYIFIKSDGQVTISKKAIEHFALSALQHEPFIEAHTS